MKCPIRLIEYYSNPANAKNCTLARSIAKDIKESKLEVVKNDDGTTTYNFSLVAKD